MAKRYWLMKSEPSAYSIDDLERDGETEWDSIRNYQARNTMRDDMRIGDAVLFYHSNAKPPGVAGTARVCALAKPDVVALDETSRYYDPRHTEENPVWMCVDIAHASTYPRVVSLAELREVPALADMRILQRGNRLSITPVTRAEFTAIGKLAMRPAPPAPVKKKAAKKSVKKKVAKKSAKRKPVKKKTAKR